MDPVAQIIRATEARTFMEGLELCREYVKTPKMWLGTSTLQPGQNVAGNFHPAAWPERQYRHRA